MFYLDYPGVDTPISARLVASLVDAVEAAVRLYVLRSDLAKVVVCEHPTMARVATVGGPRNAPRVIYRH